MKRIISKYLVFPVVVAIGAVPIFAYAGTTEWVHPSLSESEYQIIASDKGQLDKKEEADREIKRIQDAKSGKIPQADAKKEKEKGPEIIPDAPFPTGFQTPEPPPGTHDLNVISLWQGTFDDNQIRVYAGSSINDPDQGMIAIQNINTKTKKFSLSKIATPEKKGDISISKVDGESVYLTLKDGTNLLFDLSSLSFK
ncbi:hypothetical protein ACFSR7_21515 [Cohnella sp. GCM10020058]|uniref:hypothetical protein n=1 Tax=Cohnella sp. GCM10020058 TaxID=3317330 RepID=UPI00363C3B5F